MSSGEPGRRSFRAWRGDLRIHAFTIFSIAVAFVCLASSLLVLANLSALQKRWMHAGRATVFLRDDATEQATTELLGALKASPGVTKAVLLTSTEVRRELISDESDRFLATLPLSAFPASIELSFSEQISEAELSAMATKLRLLPSVESVETYERWTERLSSLVGGGVTASMLLSLVVLCAVGSVIASTIRLFMHRRREEISVLKLVGATDSFVRRPFVVEASVQGALGAVLAILLVFGLFAIVRHQFDQQLVALLGVEPSFLPWSTVLAFVSLGAVLGLASAFLTLRKLVDV